MNNKSKRPRNCECDNTHENNRTCCMPCWNEGFRKVPTNIQTCDAVKLLRKATLLRCDAGDVESYTMLSEDLTNDDALDIVFEMTANNEAYTFEYKFTKQNLLDAKVNGNLIELQDFEGNGVGICCYNTFPCTLNN